MPSVFLSYSRDDLPLIEQPEAQLTAHPDISIWRDQGKNLRRAEMAQGLGRSHRWSGCGGECREGLSRVMQTHQLALPLHPRGHARKLLNK